MDQAHSPDRRRRGRNVAIGAALLILVAGWFVLVRPSGQPAVRPSSPRPPASTFSTGGVTIAIPPGWHLAPAVEPPILRFVDRPGEDTQAFQAVLQLSNFDANSGVGPLCPQRVAPIPSNGVLLYVQDVVGFEAGIAAPSWPVPLDTSPTLPASSDACAGGRTLSWLAAGTVYQATASIGLAASAGDTKALAGSPSWPRDVGAPDPDRGACRRRTSGGTQLQGLTTADIVRLHRPERLRHDCDPSALPRQAFDRRPAERCVEPFGGFPLEADDTWTWDGYDWTAMEPSGRPSARYDAGFAYDAAHHSVVMFGGSQFAFSIGDTWHWDGSDWIPADPGSSPPPRDTSMAFDVATGHMILFGGFDDYFQVFWGDTWIL